MKFKELAERSYQKVLEKWREGDDILFHSKGLGSYLIRKITGYFFNHIGRLLKDGSVGEARWRIVRTSLFKYRGKVIFGLIRMRGVTTNEIGIANAFVEEQIRKRRKYDKSQIVGNAIALILNLRWLPNPLDRKYRFTCIDLCVKSWAKVGRYYRKDIHISHQSPGDAYTSPNVDIIVDKPTET